jgi:adenylate cyclase
VVLLLGRFGLLERTELQTYDWRMRQAYRARAASNPFPINPDIVLVEINDASIRDFAPAFGRWPWPRAIHAMLIDFVSRGKPKAIAIDVLFTEPERTSTYEIAGQSITSRDSDEALVDAVERAGNVVLLADAVDPGLTGAANPAPAAWAAPPYRLDHRVEQRPVITLPFASLAGAAAAFGHNFLVLDPDGPARQATPFVRQGDRYMPFLGLAAVMTAENYRPDEVVFEDDAIRVRNARIPLVRSRVQEGVVGSDDRWRMLINYRAPESDEKGRRPFTVYEARYVLASEDAIQRGEKPAMDPGVFKDKIVLVGINTSGLVDVFQTPHGDRLMPGIQLHASVVDSVLSQLYIRQAGDWTRIGSTFAGAIVIGLASAILPFSAAAAASLLITGVWTWFCLVAFRGGTWISMTPPLLAVAAALFVGTAYRYFVEDREKRKVKRLFGRYVSKDVYSQLLANPELAELGGKRRDMTVLFSDIRGFTSVTEKGDPEDLVAQLNEYFTRMVEIVFRHRGTVDKFVGDMVMALFSAPLDDGDHAEHAVTAAIDMVRELGELNRRWASEGRAQLDFGIGINSGDMIAGNIGSSSIMNYTVIGDNVNLGSRLESLNKEYKTRVIISDTTRSRLKGRFDIRPLGDVVVKGKTRPVSIFEVQVPSPLPAAVQPGERLAVQEGT